MRWLKNKIHRSRWLSGIHKRIKDRQRDQRFSGHLRKSIGKAVTWTHREDAVTCAREQLQYLLAIPVPPPRKGSPSKVAIRHPDLLLLDAAFKVTPVVVNADALHAAERVASIDPAELGAFQLFLAVYWLHHETLIRELRAALGSGVIVHMSCASRIARADLSIASFGDGASSGAAHLKLIGTGDRFSFDANERVLAVGSPDSYECLPRKVFQGLALIAFACNPDWLLKLDDDHRLKDAVELENLVRFAANSREAIQLGEVNFTELPSAHHRAWHFDKCASPELSRRLLTFPAPTRWAAGSSGYVLNRHALWRIFWATLYYDRWLDEILYEDVALAEVAGKTNIRIVQAQLSRAIGAVSEY